MQPPINATSLSQKLSDTIIINNVIEDVEGTPYQSTSASSVEAVASNGFHTFQFHPLGVKTDPPNLFHLFSNSLLIQLKYSLYHMVGISVLLW